MTADVGGPGGMRETWERGDEAWYEYRCLESPESSDAPLWYRSHQKVRVVSRERDEALDAPLRERLEEGMPRVYRVRFPDGHEGGAWEDELLTGPEWFSRPDPPPRPQAAPARRAQAGRARRGQRRG